MLLAHTKAVFSLIGLTVLQKILDTAAEKTWKVTSVNLDSLTESAFLKVIQDLDVKKDFRIILDCELERLNSILNLVIMSGLTSQRRYVNSCL